MPFIPRQVKPPARVPITCKVPEEVANLLKQYADFLDSSQEHIVSETLRVAFRRDKEFQAWLATMRPRHSNDSNAPAAERQRTSNDPTTKTQP